MSGVQSNPVVEKEFYEQFGRAMLGWQYVEAALFLIYHDLMQGKDHQRVSAAYMRSSAYILIWTWLMRRCVMHYSICQKNLLNGEDFVKR